MSLPYENTTSGEKALGEIQKLLRGFGCNKFGSMVDDSEGVIFIQFDWRGRECSVKASIKGYASAWLKAHPYSSRSRCSLKEYERKALDIASIAVYSILRDWIKGQITAIETGILSFEGAFLGQILLPNTTTTVLDAVMQREMLPALEQQKGSQP
ncbi:MAG: hypothetical protein Q8S92_22945 [Hydrogenophaga sp.]|uniref:hypothetical protein n=1 Tax=Hydrogenophaga sp. TaxID=1904254 RepID=UPI00273296CF|nr:hypothetical protein [Hydrogenophaga sp.]MDP3351853.1 hypothetical protein [Hydrogenophaga sp.]